MKRVGSIVATIAALVAVCLAPAPASAKGPQPATPVRHVTLILAPYLTWDDVTATSTPSLWRLAQDGALAGVNARSRARDPEQGGTPLEGALAVSAGAWALPEWSAPAAYNATETYAGGTASDAYRRIFGSRMEPSQIAYLGLPMTARANDSESLDVVLGTLGQAVGDAGGFTAAIGNSDIGFTDADSVLQRPAAVAAMDESGRIPFGDVSVDLLKSVANAPYGKATDLSRFKASLERVRSLEEAHRGPSMVVLDSGDLSRAREYSGQVTDSVAENQRTQALRTLDDVVALAVAGRGNDEVVIVASQALFADAKGAPQGVGPFVIAGAGYSGYASSSSTHRKGLVTNLDITATVLDLLGVERPVQVLGNPIFSQSGPPSVAARVTHLTHVNDAFVAVDGLKTLVANVLIGFTLVVFGLTVLVSWMAPRLSWRAARTWATALMAGLLLVLAVPTASWLAFMLVPAPVSPRLLLSAFSMIAAVLAVGAFVAADRVRLRAPVAALSLLTALILVAEQFFGAPLSILSLIGYSPLLGARYYGMGNEAAAIAFGAALVGVSLLLDEWPESAAARAMRQWGIAALGAVFVGVAAAPFLGANVGVAIWGTTGFAFAWLLMSGHAVTIRSIIVLLVVIVVVVAGFSAIDLFGGGEPTHLARALTGAGEGGLSTLWTIVLRKADTNVRVLTHTGVVWILAGVVGLAVFARWRPGSDWPLLLEANPYFAKAVTAASAAGVVAFFTEDSGVVIPSLIALYVGVALAWLMIARLRETVPR